MKTSVGATWRGTGGPGRDGWADWARWGLGLALAAGLAGAVRAASPGRFSLAWTNNLLTVRHPDLPGGPLEAWYLEAFCRAGGHGRNWGETRVPHRTRLLAAAPDGRELRFLTTVDPAVEVRHEVRAGRDVVDFSFRLVNRGTNAWDIQWFQPACLRVAGFTARGQSNYTSRSFVFTADGLRTLDQLPRTTEALYRGGQVYLPPWTRPADANPRPLCEARVANGLIGCFSSDDRWLLATASDRTFELFEGVYVCLHSDPLIDGLPPGGTQRIRQKLYLLPNDPAALLRRYRRDFPARAGRW